MLPRLTGNNINSRNKTKLQPEGFPEDACFNTWLLEHTGAEERRVSVVIILISQFYIGTILSNFHQSFSSMSEETFFVFWWFIKRNWEYSRLDILITNSDIRRCVGISP